MKKLFIILLTIFLLTGCATTRVATDIGVNIGNSFQESFAKGSVSADESIKAWPYISGQIKGIMASNYVEFPVIAQDIINRLDTLARKKTLSDEEKGFVIGSYVRLEQVAIDYAWEKYGVSLFTLFKKYMIEG